MDILKITFNVPPILYFAVQLNFEDADGSNAEEIIYGFKDIRVNVNDVKRDSDLVQQALNLEYAISIDYPTKLIAIADGNTVSIYFKNDKVLTSYTCSFFNTQTVLDFDQLTGDINVMSVNSPYAQNTFAYTLENKKFKIQSSIVGYYFQIEALITVTKNNGQFSEFTILNKLITYNEEASISYNQIIHRLMAANLDIETQGQYKPTLLDITVKATNINYNTVVQEIILPTIKFVAGLKNSLSNFGIIDFNLKPNRVTLFSYPTVNLLLPAGNYTLKTLRNGVQDMIFPIATIDDVVTFRQLNFENYSIGDIITAVVVNDDFPNLPTQEKVYCIFPEGRYFNTIFWEDEFLMQKSIDCLGAFNIKSELDYTSQKTMIDLVEKVNYLETSKEVKLQINTGWLMFSDTDSIESLMRAKKVWLPIPNTSKIIDLRPSGKSILNQDSEKENIEFNLEFIINRKYNEETYSL